MTDLHDIIRCLAQGGSTLAAHLDHAADAVTFGDEATAVNKLRAIRVLLGKLAIVAEAGIPVPAAPTNCFTCAHSNADGIECRLQAADNQWGAAVSWSFRNCDGDTGAPLPDATGCPGHKVRP